MVLRPKFCIIFLISKISTYEKIKTRFKKEIHEKRMEDRKIAKDNNELRVNSNLYTDILKSGSKYVKREKALLWHSETGIITRLRSEHIKLNFRDNNYSHKIDLCKFASHACFRRANSLRFAQTRTKLAQNSHHRN